MIKAVSSKLRSSHSSDHDVDIVETVERGLGAHPSPPKTKPPLQVRLNKLDILQSRGFFIRELNDILDFWGCPTNSVRHKADLAVRLAGLYFEISKDKSIRDELLSLRGEEAQVVLDTLLWVGGLQFFVTLCADQGM